MDKKARSRLRGVITQGRHLLEEDIRIQLRRLGIEKGGKTIPAGRLSHLSPDDFVLRYKILAAIKKEQVKDVKRREAYDRYVRHVGFTYLNRLAALRAMEVRGLIKETVIRRDDYAGMSRRGYEISEREGINDRAEITKRSLLEAFEEVSQEINVLFDVNDEYSLLFPSPRTLDALISLLGGEVPEEDWCEEDIIGWIYQYYNSEARSEFKKRRRKPRPDDIPVINQFYTPRWLVRALVDNTLGRLWLEMKGRIPKPGEAEPPSEDSLRNPQGETLDEYCSYFFPLRQDTPTREKKSIREIKVLDPACGSGHFLVYAFNVLYRMYLEDEHETPREEIPRLILENNLFGIDIDLRSVQLAALSLYLKAKEYNPNVKIKRMNLVCADVRITDGDLKREFLKRIEPDVDLQRIFAKLFDILEYTYDIGSLLKVREPFERLIRERGLAQVRFQLRPKGQVSFSRGGLKAQTSISLVEEKEAVPVKPAVTLNEMLAALLAFEREGVEKKDMGTMLFAAEAEKSVGLLSLLSQKYDVVVMNPPYGDMPKSTKEYAREHYQRTHYDYYAAFIEQALNLCEVNGFIGMLTGRTFMFLKWFENVRTDIFYNEAKPELIIDLGSDVIDEAVGVWAASLARKLGDFRIKLGECLFIRLTQFRMEEIRIEAFEKIVYDYSTKQDNPLVYPVKLEMFQDLPRKAYSYWVPASLCNLFKEYPPLDRELAEKACDVHIARLKVGLQTGDQDRFVRYFWEVDKKDIGKKNFWVPIAKGGKEYYSNINMVVNWNENGKEVKEYPGSVVRNKDFYFSPGLCWNRKAGSIRLGMRVLPSKVIFNQTADSLFPTKESYIYPLLALGNSLLTAYLMLALDPMVNNRPPGYVSQIPIALQLLDNKTLSDLAHNIYDLKREWDTGNEVSTLFIKPWILQVSHGFKIDEKPITQHPLGEDFKWSSWPETEQLRNIVGTSDSGLNELATLCVEREKLLRKQIYHLQRLIDKKIYDIYALSSKDIKILETELSTLHGFPKRLKQSKEEMMKPKLGIQDHIIHLISYYIQKSLEEDRDGILTIEELLHRISYNLAKDFEKDQSHQVESELTQVLKKSLEDWLAEDFFEFHVGLYERRPIIWQMTSSNFSHRRGSKGAFNCFIYYHKLSKDTIPKIRTRREYLKGVFDGTKWRTQRLRRELQKARESGDKNRERQLQEEYEKSLDELNELQAFDKKLEEVSKQRDKLTELDEDATWVERKIAEVRDNGWNPVIDYGVRVNIEPLKEAGLLHKAAYRVK